MSIEHISGACLGPLFHRENAVLVRFLMRMTRCRAAAEDLAQMAWLKILSARQRGVCRLSRESELRAYLYEVAQNTFIDEHTRKHGRSRTEATDPAALEELATRTGNVTSAADEVEKLEAAAVVQRAMRSLPDRQREVLELWSAGESTLAISRKCAAPYDTVLSRKKYGLARLRESLSPASPAFE